jgi:subtilisin-like proprotein convertase family protein
MKLIGQLKAVLGVPMMEFFLGPNHMKIYPLFGVACVLSLSQPVFAQTTTTSQSFPVNLAVPDNNAVGISSTMAFTTPIVGLTDLNVTLNLSGTFNGDVYAYLRHEDSGAFAVLLNRPGRRTADLLGYSDDGLNVTFDDQATNGDIHNYRMTLSGNHTTALAGQLTGSWAPDGRAIDPFNVLDTDPRTSLLAAFSGIDPRGDWTLFVADASAGAGSTVASWGLQAVGVVPEPGSWILLTIGGAAFLLATRRSRKQG